ncbi:BrnA antitoxin family protein [Rhodopila sp.]|uniref:BrnA antitoxin family protein n=1 Tax=Rhodopila sp. TaxID=2480087 RepID=UPI003D09CCC9
MRRKNIVGYELDLEQPPPLSAAQRAELKALATVPDEQIDTSDIPLLSEEFWNSAISNPFYRPIKQQLTVRLDADVLIWLRSAGPGYQTKLNAILREAMVREVASRARSNRRISQAASSAFSNAFSFA